MMDGKARAAEPSLFQGLAGSPAREATRRAFYKLFQPARERENRPVYLDTPVQSKPSRLASRLLPESPTSKINLL